MNWMSEPTTAQKKPLNSVGRVMVAFDGTSMELWDGRFACPDCGNNWWATVRLFKAKGRVICPQCNVLHEVDLLQEAA